MKNQTLRIITICSLLAAMILGAALLHQTSQLRALREDRLNDEVDSLHRELLQAPPEYFMGHGELEDLLADALDQAYETIQIEDESWGYRFGSIALHTKNQHVPTNLRRSLTRDWMAEIDRKLAFDGLSDQLSKYPHKRDHIESRLRLISLQPNPYTALWAAKHLDEMNALSADTLRALEVHTDDHFYGDDVSEFIAKVGPQG